MIAKTPPIKFTCRYCGSENEGDPHEFKERYTMPPSFEATCGFCHGINTCFPTALVARAAGR